jgi:hypothetical protein
MRAQSKPCWRRLAGQRRELDHAVNAVLMAQTDVVRAVDLGLRAGREVRRAWRMS